MGHSDWPAKHGSFCRRRSPFSLQNPFNFCPCHLQLPQALSLIKIYYHPKSFELDLDFLFCLTFLTINFFFHHLFRCILHSIIFFRSQQRDCCCPSSSLTHNTRPLNQFSHSPSSIY